MYRVSDQERTPAISQKQSIEQLIYSKSWRNHWELLSRLTVRRNTEKSRVVNMEEIKARITEDSRTRNREDRRAWSERKTKLRASRREKTRACSWEESKDVIKAGSTKETGAKVYLKKIRSSKAGKCDFIDQTPFYEAQNFISLIVFHAF